MSLVSRALGVLAVGVAIACGATSDPAVSPDAGDTGVTGDARGTLPRDCTVAADVEATIFAPRCATAGCHTGPTPAGALDLGRPGVAGRVLGKPSALCPGQTLVVERWPEGSYLVDKVSLENPACGSRMPHGGPPLSSEEVACVRAYAASLRGPDASVDDAPTDARVDGAPAACAPEELRCGGACVDPLSDPLHCGGCGQPCPIACANGACVDVCPPGTTDCAGACVDTTSDRDHCGACNSPCARGMTCVASACACPTVSFAAELRPILTASCAGNNCHSGAAPAAGMSLVAARAYGSLVNRPTSTCASLIRVVPGDVDRSYLMNKLTGVGMCSGGKMPLNGVLGTDDIDLFRAWICNGAPNN